jgi:hypothetical protein
MEICNPTVINLASASFGMLGSALLYVGSFSFEQPPERVFVDTHHSKDKNQPSVRILGHPSLKKRQYTPFLMKISILFAGMIQVRNQKRLIQGR